jgi:hypothetical protein
MPKAIGRHPGCLHPTHTYERFIEPLLPQLTRLMYLAD